MSILTEADLCFFRDHGYIVRTDLISADELAEYLDLFNRDRTDYGYRWHPCGYRQQANYDALVTTPVFWKDHPDPETRAFYGNLNEVTRIYLRAFGLEERQD